MTTLQIKRGITKKAIILNTIKKKIFQRAEFFAQRFLYSHPNKVGYLSLIRSIYRLLLIPDDWIRVFRLSDRACLYFIVHLKFGEKGIHPLQEQAFQKLQMLLKCYQ